MMYRFYFGLIIYFLFNHVGFGQHFSAEADDEVTVDSYFEVTFTLENGGSCQGFKPPLFDKFNVLAGPNKSSSISIINGKRSDAISYTYTLEPTEKGVFSIGSASIECGGKIFKSQPLTVSVVAPMEHQSLGTALDQSDDVLIRLEANVRKAYLGQQIILDYKLYSRVNISTVRLDQSPKIDNAYVVEYENYDAGRKIEKINGKQYYTKILRRQILFPQQTKEIHIAPGLITVGIPSEDNDPFSALFGVSTPKQLKTNSLTISVKPLPEPIPAGFSGAVGQYQYEVSVDRTELSTDDALSIYWTIIGNGDSKRLTAPSIEKSTYLDAYPTQVITDSTQEVKNELIFKKKFFTNLAPIQVGETTVQTPDFIYFDPKSENYKTIKGKSFDLKITQGHQKPNADQPNSKDIAPTGEITFLQANKNLILGTLGGIGLLALTIFLLRPKKKVTSTDQQPAVQMKKEMAQPIIPPNPVVNEGLRLMDAQRFLEDGDIKGFYSALNHALQTTLMEKYGLTMAQMNRADIAAGLAKSGMMATKIDQWVSLFDRIEFNMFSGIRDEVNAQQIMSLMKQLIGSDN